MSEKQKTTVRIETTVAAPLEKVWNYFHQPSHITQWNFASPEWHTPSAQSDFRVGGKFSSRMEARDRSMGFDFEGTFTAIEVNRFIAYTIGDGREVHVHFRQLADGVEVVEEFEAEPVNPVDMQRMGWQAILDNFKYYTESH